MNTQAGARRLLPAGSRFMGAREGAEWWMA